MKISLNVLTLGKWRVAVDEILCILCGKRNNHIAITENGYHGIKCENCGIIYISPRPSATEISAIYKDHDSKKYADTQFQFQRYKGKEAGQTLLRIRKYRESGSILELGPGGGFFLTAARVNGYEPFGIELNPIEARWINEKLLIPCETAALSKSSFGGRKFDIIYHKDVLSHFYDPLDTFRIINQSLNKNGILVFETGNIADVKATRYKWFSQFSYPDHLFFYGEKSIETLLNRTGFKSLCVYQDAILPQLCLQKLLWKMKDPLKDKKTVENIGSQAEFDNNWHQNMSVKRRLRTLYRYTNHYLGKIGPILPKKGWPLKLLVIAEKYSK
jgi:SAM-dependent methyltransferase